jgi:hypothetical protein
MARQPSALPPPLHSNIVIMAEPGRALVRQDHHRGIRRGVFTSVPQLERAIYDYIEHNNADPKPFVWTKSASDIIRKVNRGRAALQMPPLPRHE